MTDLIFSKGIKKLEQAFRINKLSNASLKIYYEKLKEVNDRVWIREIERVIEDEDRFPSIKCLLRYCGKQKSYSFAGHELKQL